MVRIHVKPIDVSGEKEFLYECSSNLLIEEIASEVIRISNLQSKIYRLVFELEPRLLPFMAIPKDQVIHNRPLSYLVLRNHFESIERELVAKFDSLGFSDSTQCQQLLSDVGLLEEDTTQLKLAGKELIREKQLCDYIGRNEKTKIILKLQPTIIPPS